MAVRRFGSGTATDKSSDRFAENRYVGSYEALTEYGDLSYIVVSVSAHITVVVLEEADHCTCVAVL